MDDVQLDFVLVRGPESVCRRLHVAVPRDGTPVTIGRALRCGAVLDPWLAFASQVQCSVFCVPADGEASTTSPDAEDAQKDATPSTANATAQRKGTETPDRRPLPETTSGGSSAASAASGALRPPVPARLFLTDLCSSNGTFLNGVRVGSTDAVELKDGDACIFGGMRDVEVGTALPEDAFAGPELVVWRVDIVGAKGGQPTQYPYEATPALLPSPDTLLREEQEVLRTALRSLRKTPRPLCTPNSTGDATPAAAVGGGASPAVPVQLFTGQTPATEARRPERARESADQRGGEEEEEGGEGACMIGGGEAVVELEPGKDEEQRRSGTVAARVSAQAATTALAPSAEEAAPTPEPQSPHRDDTDFFLLLNTLETPTNAPVVTEPPHPAYFHAVRVGCHTFHVPVSALLGVYMAEVAETRAAAKDGEGESAEEAGQKEAAAGGKRGRGQKASNVKSAAKRPKTEDHRPTTKERLKTLQAPLYGIHFTASHWKWVMDSPNSSGCDAGAPLPTGLSATAFHALLPVTSIQTILVCRERLGISVELRDGCTIPLVRPGVLDGAPENRWLVWMLEDCQIAPAAAGAAKAVSSKTAAEGKHRSASAARAEEAAVDFTQAQTLSLYEQFNEWIEHLAAFYSAYKVPAPLAIDPDTFDKLFAPEMIVE